MTIGLVFGLVNAGRAGRDDIFALLILPYLATVTMWMVGSFSLAKAKGYGSDMMGAVFMLLFILGFCFPIAPFVFPAVVLFGLKDKTRERRW